MSRSATTSTPTAEPARSAHGTAQETADQIRTTGTVQWFSDRGFGFIRRHDDDVDVYVHYSGIVGEGFRTLTADSRVAFTVRMTRRGPEAVDVVVLDDGAGSPPHPRDV